MPFIKPIDETADKLNEIYVKFQIKLVVNIIKCLVEKLNQIIKASADLCNWLRETKEDYFTEEAIC